MCFTMKSNIGDFGSKYSIIDLLLYSGVNLPTTRNHLHFTIASHWNYAREKEMHSSFYTLLIKQKMGFYLCVCAWFYVFDIIMLVSDNDWNYFFITFFSMGSLDCNKNSKMLYPRGCFSKVQFLPEILPLKSKTGFKIYSFSTATAIFFQLSKNFPG